MQKSLLQKVSDNERILTIKRLGNYHLAYKKYNNLKPKVIVKRVSKQEGFKKFSKLPAEQKYRRPY